jgi:hypothetical protein
VADLVRSDAQLRADASEPMSPGWWLENLGKQLYADQPRLNLLDSYFRGNPPLPSSAPSARPAYQLFQRTSRVNFAETIVEAVRHRMIPLGFRTGADGDELGDKAARLLWQQNDLDVESVDVHQGMLALSRSYAMVGKVDDQVLITAEDPRQVITSHDPATRRVRAGLKVYRDESMSTDWAYLHLPGWLYVAGRPAPKSAEVLASGFSAKHWTWSGTFPIPEAQGRVPIVRFQNARGMGEFEPHVDTLDRINTMILQRVVIAVMQAFRQRAVKGELPSHDAAGNPIDYDSLFAAGPDALWTLPPGVEMWESAGVDMTPVLASVKADLQYLAASTFTPMHIFMPEAVTGSAEGASLAREGLVFKTRGATGRAGIGWRETVSLAFLFQGDPERANLAALEPMWASPEQLSLAERGSAAAQAKASGVPWRSIMTEIWQFPPELVDRMESERAADAFIAQLAVPQQAVAGQLPSAARPAIEAAPA